MYLCLIQYHLKEEVKKILFAVFRETVKIEKTSEIWSHIFHWKWQFKTFHRVYLKIKPRYTLLKQAFCHEV